MKIVFSDKHRQHATSAQLSGYAPTYFEIPARAETILAALQAARFGPVMPPADHGMVPILAVHDAGFVAFLRAVYPASRARFGDNPVLPDTFAGRGRGHTRPSFPGLTDHSAFDISCPLLEGSWTAASWSAQCALTAAALGRGGDRVADALCRPPGPHAADRLYVGFCYLNNAA